MDFTSIFRIGSRSTLFLSEIAQADFITVIFCWGISTLSGDQLVADWARNCLWEKNVSMKKALFLDLNIINVKYYNKQHYLVCRKGTCPEWPMYLMDYCTPYIVVSIRGSAKWKNVNMVIYGIFTGIQRKLWLYCLFSLWCKKLVLIPPKDVKTSSKSQKHFGAAARVFWWLMVLRLRSGDLQGVSHWFSSVLGWTGWLTNLSACFCDR